MDSPQFGVADTELGVIVWATIQFSTPDGVEHNFHKS
jgi:hypothetical protein